jgi:transcriptional regulator with XRE-family HTH domain
MKRAVQPEGEIFGERLRELRQKAGMSQEAVAQASGLTKAYISNMETGIKVPSLTTVLRLAVSLGCRVTALTSVFDKVEDLAGLLPK